MIETEKMRPRIILLGRQGQETRENFSGQEMRNRSGESPREYSFESRIRTKGRMFVRDIGYPLQGPGLRGHSHHGDRKSALSTVRRTVPAIVQLCRCRNLKSALEIDSLAYSDGHPSISFQINRYFSCLSKSQSYCIESDNVNTPNNLENLESRSPGCISDTLNFLDFFHGLHRCYCLDQSVRNFCKILTTREVLKALSK